MLVKKSPVPMPLFWIGDRVWHYVSGAVFTVADLRWRGEILCWEYQPINSQEWIPSFVLLSTAGPWGRMGG